MKDLVKLYSIYSVSGTEGEKEICDWICSWLDERKVPYTREGNTLYSISSTSAVMLSAHLDQVKTNGRAAHIYKDDFNTIIAYNDKWQRTSLGADDKNGVWLILKLLEDGWIFDWVISESEEIGCVGIKKIEQELKKSLADFCIVLDRRGNYDILNKGAGTNYCEALAYNLKNFFNDGSVVTTGSVSDTQVICKYIEAVNMSVAYHNPHTATEETDYERLLQIKDNLTCLFTENFTHYPAHPQDYDSSRGGY
jgi:di/tripeptidase